MMMRFIKKEICPRLSLKCFQKNILLEIEKFTKKKLKFWEENFLWNFSNSKNY